MNTSQQTLLHRNLSKPVRVVGESRSGVELDFVAMLALDKDKDKFTPDPSKGGKDSDTPVEHYLLILKPRDQHGEHTISFSSREVEDVHTLSGASLTEIRIVLKL